MLTQEARTRCEELTREFIKRIEPWGHFVQVKILWTERGTYTLNGASRKYRAIPSRDGVTLNAPWCEAYSQEFRKSCENKPHGSGWKAMRERDQWRHETHLEQMPSVLSPWEPLLSLWEIGAMIDRLYEDETEGTRCLLLEFDR